MFIKNDFLWGIVVLLFQIDGIQTPIEFSSHSTLIKCLAPPLPENLYCIDFTVVAMSCSSKYPFYSFPIFQIFCKKDQMQQNDSFQTASNIRTRIDQLPNNYLVNGTRNIINNNEALESQNQIQSLVINKFK